MPKPPFTVNPLEESNRAHVIHANACNLAFVTLGVWVLTVVSTGLLEGTIISLMSLLPIFLLTTSLLLLLFSFDFPLSQDPMRIRWHNCILTTLTWTSRILTFLGILIDFLLIVYVTIYCS